MAYELRPQKDELRSVQEVARILEREFAYVCIDADDGLAQAKSRAQWIESARPEIFFGQHQKALEAASRLKNLAYGEALTVEFGDNDKRTVRTTVMPGETIKFGFASNEDQIALRALVERCARALGCTLDVI